ncbi:hypothetical protein C9374_011537 [Naegleria lovaniensis]|uniref:Folliculin n=1 Tax=Naegleria lovaniensis TaxID=51637 RepID=A0AA88KR00_NAELO|nr:uncharacterized protein C9374_011537 [Naegleria lovaniensis]KAG2392812.1 hypothetical protein C9374_011537 [Naegleria lovaniensis]
MLTRSDSDFSSPNHHQKVVVREDESSALSSAASAATSVTTTTTTTTNTAGQQLKQRNTQNISSKLIKPGASRKGRGSSVIRSRTTTSSVTVSNTELNNNNNTTTAENINNVNSNSDENVQANDVMQLQNNNNNAQISSSVQSNSSMGGNSTSTNSMGGNSVNSTSFMSGIGIEGSSPLTAMVTPTHHNRGFSLPGLTKQQQMELSPQAFSKRSGSIATSSSSPIKPASSKLTSMMQSHYGLATSQKPTSTTAVNNYNKNGILVTQFCEQKGPSFVFCTQMINYIQHLNETEKFIDDHKQQYCQRINSTRSIFDDKSSTVIDPSHEQQGRDQSSSIMNEPSISTTNTTTFNEPETIPSLASKDLIIHLQQNNPNLFVAENYSSTPNSKTADSTQDHFQQLLMLSSIEHFTMDKDNDRIFVSSHQENSTFSAHFKSLAIRSTSAEISVGQGREGPVLFGDEINGYNFAYIFKVKDSMARGFARWFAFVLMDPSLSLLSISWPFLKTGFGKIVKLIRTRSQQVFVEEKEKQKRSGSTNALNEEGNNVEDHGYKFFHAGGPLSADLFRQKRSKGPMRDLPILLNYPNFYADLHSCFAGLLQSFQNKISEVQIPNIPYEKIDMQNFQALHKVSSSHQMQRIESFSSIVSEVSEWDYSGGFHTLSDFSRLIYQCILTKLSLDGSNNNLDNVTHGIDLIDSDDLMEEAFNQSEEIIRSIIYNVIIGNQLVVRGDDAQLRNEICLLFKKLVPPHCAKIILDSETYKYPYDANFLTVPTSVHISDSIVDFKFVILINVTGSLASLENITIHTEEERKETTLGKEFESLFFQNFYQQVQQQHACFNVTLSNILDMEQHLIQSLVHDWTRKAIFFIYFQKNKLLKEGHQQGKRLNVHDHSILNEHANEIDIPVLRYFAKSHHF